jgi:hypothetical protein
VKERIAKLEEQVVLLTERADSALRALQLIGLQLNRLEQAARGQQDAIEVLGRALKLTDAEPEAPSVN